MVFVGFRCVLPFFYETGFNSGKLLELKRAFNPPPELLSLAKIEKYVRQKKVEISLVLAHAPAGV
jgi:hypothetical protein